ncbi:SGNH/GDSL hydrolase family protein, partial [bacterium]|nr:SGNH/GDSL hydrolase family protein [candidate division CSSED10-310 bacterium]
RRMAQYLIPIQLLLLMRVFIPHPQTTSWPDQMTAMVVLAVIGGWLLFFLYGALSLSPPRFILFAALMLPVFLLLAEAYLQCWQPNGEYYYRDTFNMVTQAPVPAGYEWYSVPALRYENTYLASRDFKGKMFSLAPSPGIIRIICLGGSTTACSATQRKTGMDYPNLLQSYLNAGDNKRFEVMNCGVNSYTILQAWHWFNGALRVFDPDIVIVHSSANNTVDIQHASQQEKLAAIQAIQPGPGATMRHLLRRSRLAMLGRLTLESAHWLLERPLGLPVRPSVSLDEYVQILDRFLEASKEDGFDLVLSHEPTTDIYQVTSGFSQLNSPYLEQMATLISETCRENDLMEVDLRPLLRERSRSFIFLDYVHLTDYGNQLLAGLMADRILQRDEHRFPVEAKNEVMKQVEHVQDPSYRKVNAFMVP